MAFDTDRWRDFAARLVERFGSPFVLRQVNPGNYDGATEQDEGPPPDVEYAVTGVLVDASFGRRFLQADSATREGMLFVCAASGLPTGIEPLQGWEVHNSDTDPDTHRRWTIGDLPKAVRPDGVTPVFFVCSVVR